MLERPVVNDDGEITGWSVGWGTDRPFAIDMAGFAINLSYLLSHTSAKFADSVKRGYQESEFLKHLVHLEDLEPLSRDKVLVWHTRTEQTNLNKVSLLSVWFPVFNWSFSMIPDQSWKLDIFWISINQKFLDQNFY